MAEILIFGQDDGWYCPKCAKHVYLEAVSPGPSKAYTSKQVYSYRCHACQGVLDMHFSLDEDGMTEDMWVVFRFDVPLLPGEEA